MTCWRVLDRTDRWRLERVPNQRSTLPIGAAVGRCCALPMFTALPRRAVLGDESGLG
jgi:hypothetical protein